MTFGRQLRLLGSFEFRSETGERVAFRSEKERALLAYLTVEASRSHSRRMLSGLLWPEQPDETANNNLRVTLHRLRHAVGDPSADMPLLIVSSDAVQLNPDAGLWTDVASFDALLARTARHHHERLATCAECMASYEEAAALYRGDFLEGLYPADSVPFSEWSLLKQEYLRSQLLRILFLLADHHRWRGALDCALPFARRQVELEPWREEAHCQVMTILALRGERSAALRQYETCRRALLAELNVEPAEETRVLHERILAQRKGKLSNLPENVKPFVGRRTELSLAGEYLADPGSRLITIVGPGGIGKSCLAAEAAAGQRFSFLNGVFLVELSSVSRHTMCSGRSQQSSTWVCDRRKSPSTSCSITSPGKRSCSCSTTMSICWRPRKPRPGTRARLFFRNCCATHRAYACWSPLANALTSAASESWFSVVFRPRPVATRYTRKPPRLSSFSSSAWPGATPTFARIRAARSPSPACAGSWRGCPWQLSSRLPGPTLRLPPRLQRKSRGSRLPIRLVQGSS